MSKLLPDFSLSQRSRLFTSRILILGLGVFLISALVPVYVLQHGMDSPSPIGAYMNGSLPSTTPGGVTSWEVVEAFPNLSFKDPITFTPEPNSNRLHVGQRDGKIYFFDNDSLTNSKTTFLDISSQVAVVWDGGLIGMAFHPRFGIDSNYVYLYYNARVANASYSTANEGFGYPGTFFNVWGRLSRFEVNPVTHIADPASELIMINKRLYNGSHRGGAITFDKHGYLFAAFGDEFRYQTAQEMEDVLEGGIIRIDVDKNPVTSHAPIRTLPQGNLDEYSGIGYFIPNDNPWLDPAGNSFEEYYSTGHRQPHRMSYDSTSDQIWVGEVGGNTREEVNLIQKGGNYGHPFREGLIVGSKNPPSVIVGTLTDPVIDFPHIETSVVIGGFVYRGDDNPYFQGKYICGGYAKDKLWAIDYDSISGTATKEFICSFTPERLCTFGVDQSNELYMTHQGNNAKIYKIAPVSAAPSAPALLSQVGAFSDLSNMTPTAGVIPYELIEPFWSDKAEKFRWLMIPNDGTHNTPAEQIVFSEEGDWEFPQGAVLIKHFEMVLDETNPSIRTKLETRFLVHGSDDKYYGLTYKWKADQTDAELLTTSVEDTFTVATSGFPREEIWHYPSRAECLSCHNDAAKGVLGPITRQFNNEIYYPSSGRTANQLITLEHLGIFSPSLDTSAANLSSILTSKNKADLSASIEDRARTYLDANCSSCHRPGTANRGVFDARLQIPFDAQGFLYGSVSDEIGITGGKVVIPGDLDRSILYQRINDVHSGISMPPLAKNKIDTAGVELIKEWILGLEAEFPAEGTGLEGTYYDNSNLTNQKLTRIDGEIDFYWGTSSPDTSQIGDNSFSVSWTGKVQPLYNETYTFYTMSDDGVRLYVDGTLLIDHFTNQTPTEWSGDITLTAGQKVDIMLEYFESSGISLVELYWESESQEKEIIPARYLFPPTAQTLNQAICIEPIANKITSDPAFLIEAEASSGLDVTYQILSGPASVSGNQITLAGTSGKVTVQASQAGNSTYLPAPTIEETFYVYANSSGQGNGLLGTYFDNSDLTNQVLQRVDKEIDFNWGSGSPDGTINRNTYSVRWEGLLEAPHTETFTFITNSDDGVKLWVDNTLIIDQWGAQELTTYSADISLTKGQKVPIKLEYQEENAYSLVNLSWTSPSISPQTVPRRYLSTSHIGAFEDYAEFSGTDTSVISILDNDLLPIAADSSSITIEEAPWYGTAIVDSNLGVIKYVAKNSQPDKDRFVYSFKDINGIRSALATVYMSRTGTPSIFITSPENGDTIYTTSVQIDFTSEGELGDADHVELILDGGTPVIIPALSGSYTLNGITLGNRQVIARLMDDTNQPLSFDTAKDTVNFRRDPAVAATCDPLPAGWATMDIGNIGASGSGCDSSNTFRLTGSGEKLGGTADGFFYVYKNLPDDGEIIARVSNVVGSENTSKGFIMMREDFTPGARRAVMALNQDGTVSFQRRLTPDVGSTSTATSLSSPIWLRLVRTGAVIRGYYSTSGSSWTQLGPSPSITSDDIFVGIGVSNHNTGDIMSADFDNITLIGATNVINPFPVSLTDFAAELNNIHVDLNWETSSELNSESFEIQRSQGNDIFESLSNIPAAGNSDQTNQYSFTDKQPIFGQNLYRLKMIDLDGQFTYSEVESIVFSPEAFKIRPIPTQGILYLDFTEAWYVQKTDLTIEIIDPTGRVIKNFNFTEAEIKPTISIDISDQPKGIYFLKCSDKRRKLMMQKLIKI